MPMAARLDAFKKKLDAIPSTDDALAQIRDLNERLAAQNELDRDDEDCTPVTYVESLRRNGRI